MQAFECWCIDNKNILCEVVFDLFSDSLRCYKFDIERPAFLLAYQGMMLYLREVLRNSTRPEWTANEEEWRSILRKVDNEDTWDGELFDYLRRSGTKPIFCISQKTRDEILYFKDKRNVCAHHKNDNFIKAHVLTLYSFISHNLLSISVEGGKATLLKEFEDYFNPALTSPTEDIKPLLDKIPQIVARNELSEFIKELITLKGHRGSKRMSTLEQLLEIPALFDVVTEFIKSDDGLLITFLANHPGKILNLNMDDAQIRSFWYNNVTSEPYFFKVLCHLLEAGKIGDTSECFKHLLHKYFVSNRYLEFPDDVLPKLKFYGYFDEFCRNYLSRSKTTTIYSDINYNRIHFYNSHIQAMLPWNRMSVECLVDVFNKGPFPYILGNDVSRLLKSEDGDSQNFMDIISELGVEVPSYINFIENNTDEKAEKEV